MLEMSIVHKFCLLWQGKIAAKLLAFPFKKEENVLAFQLKYIQISKLMSEGKPLYTLNDKNWTILYANI